MELTREKALSAVVNVICRNKGLDPVSLAEKILDRMEYMAEDADAGDFPRMTFTEAGKTEEPEEPDVLVRRPSAPVRGMRRTPPPPSPDKAPASRMILMPDDPEFKQAAKGVTDRRTPVASGLRLSSADQPVEPAGVEQLKHWTYASLTQALEKHTPPRLKFTPKGMPENMQVEAVRNIQQLIGVDRVRLEYASPRVSGDRAEADGGGGLGAVVIGLTATHMFALTDAQLDVEAAMNHILEQLEGLYAPRDRSMEPADIGPPPIRSWNIQLNPDGSVKSSASPMGASERIEMADGWQNVNDPQTSLLSSVHRENARYGGDARRRPVDE